MKTLFPTLFFFIAIIGYSQVEITLDATIQDQNTRNPVPYVNIGFKNKVIGTVSNLDGSFQLTFNDRVITSQDTLVISHLGYATKELSTKELLEGLENTNKIFLSPTTNTLAETVIVAPTFKSKTLGYMTATAEVFGYWKDARGLGGEIATYIDVRDKQSKLKELNFQVSENQSDSLLVRVNIYDVEKNLPGKNLLQQEIYKTIIGKGKQRVNLNPYNIIVDDDIIVSLELIKVYGDVIEFAIGGVKSGKQSYVKLVSQSSWLPKSNVSMSFSLETSVPSKNAKSNDRDKPNAVLVLWDNSLSLKKRNIAKEIELLKRLSLIHI